MLRSYKYLTFFVIKTKYINRCRLSICYSLYSLYVIIIIWLTIMVRKLKYHEQKLLKKVDFISWEADNNLHEIKILKRYRIQKREDYTKYNKLAREIRELGKKIKEIDPEHPFRIEQSALLLEKLYMMGLIATKWDLSLTQKVSASSFCRRRLPVVMVRNKMSQNLKMAIQFIEQGHVRVGTEVVKDPAFLITRNLEDFVTWVDTSAIKIHVLEYNDARDDFDMA
ncbi:U3 small nucleolar ribonucleoprotein protein IMP3 [Apis mellifera]|uniref:U3 small nucleolar ribonucleoprotein protein IMP3 n=1 Tax=Apis mellifera TaxID=7460 RepID=A0A7M7R7U2_APIME|nr:U3 small nucleolar ribonucleoprotein protein IMP3 [Apis mellifera]|eukprot:XP_623809.3 U3 small nucleolar ribonucleoprotein protein IMP3 [Apis mellifera]